MRAAGMRPAFQIRAAACESWPGARPRRSKGAHEFRPLFVDNIFQWYDLVKLAWLSLDSFSSERWLSTGIERTADERDTRINTVVD